MEAQEIWEALLKYDREIVSPRFEDMNKRFDAMVTRDEFNSHMDRIYKRLERIDSEIWTT